MSAQKRGFSLIEVLIGSGILTVFVAAIASILNMAATTLGGVRAAQIGQALLTERMEWARNVSYNALGTQGGIPDGVLNPLEVVDVNGTGYTIVMSVIYVDDPKDGVSPADTTPTDYKRVRAEVTWDGVFASRRPLVLWTDVGPKALETDVGGGTVEVRVTNAMGVGVVNATVQLEAPTASPSVSLTVLTDAEGMVRLPGAPACVTCYRVTVTKAGYTTERTYSTAEVANPFKPDLTVLEGETTQVVMAIDLTSSVTFRAYRENYTPFVGVLMRVRGSKLIGRTALDEPVYKFEQNVVTGIGGQVVKTGMEWDTYTVFIPDGSSVDMAGTMPFTPFSLLPNNSTTFNMVVVLASANSILVRIKDDSLNPIASASVELKNDLVGYIATQSTAAQSAPNGGQTYFVNLPTTNTPFQINISAADYLGAFTEATVSGDIIEDFILAPL